MLFRSLTIDYALLVIDSGRGIGNGWMVPSGPVRAPLPLQLHQTSGLRKVDKSQMTHKNPALRNGPPVPARKDSAGSNRGKSPAPNKKPDTMRTKKPSKKVLEGNKWTIENFENARNPLHISLFKVSLNTLQ